MTWRTAAEHTVEHHSQSLRAGRRVAPAPLVMPADQSTVHAVGDDWFTACGENSGGLRLTPSVAWPPPNPRIIACPDCLAATSNDTH